jgi:RNA polymerase sigma-70 factor (ECF subfamily)
MSATKRATTPLELAERAELREVLIKAVDALPPRRREVFVLARFHGRSYRDIADIMDISPQTVANQVSAAVRDLRRRLRPEMAKFLPDPRA